MDASTIYALFLAFAGLFVLGACRLSGAADDRSNENTDGDCFIIIAPASPGSIGGGDLNARAARLRQHRAGAGACTFLTTVKRGNAAIPTINPPRPD